MSGPGVTRRLWSFEREPVQQHLLRLDPEDRRLRFGGQVNDHGIRAYCDRLDWNRAVLIGHLVAGEIRGLGELKPLAAAWPRAAEVALSVERG
ncbi:MAG: GNAT family N-acetyltransferase, partial [Geminicoccaceae bacterium]|nr:GNAT family N-acetyltransferase [Geminicoccaceae bacterium]